MTKVTTEQEKRDFREVTKPDGLVDFLCYVDTIEDGKRAFLTKYNLKTLKKLVDSGGRVFLNYFGAGYIITTEGDLQSLFNTGHSNGIGRYAVESAVANGAKTLDAFDVDPAISVVNLPAYYREFGFVETGRVEFDDNLAPYGWDYKRYGRPDVVFMAIREVSE